MKAEKDIKGLIKALDHNDSHIKEAAAEAVIDELGVNAVELLIAEFRNPQRGRGDGICRALKKIGNSAVSPLITALKDTDNKVRSSAAYALGKSGVVGPLINALKDPDIQVRYGVLSALGTMASSYALSKTGVVEPLIDLLKDPDSKIRSSAAYVLGKTKDARVLDPLFTALSDSDENVRCTVAKALAYDDLNIRDTPRWMEPLITALNDSNSHVRRYAAVALGEIGDTRAVEPLVEARRKAHFRDDMGKYVGAALKRIRIRSQRQSMI